jgi:hypothetical protein
LPCNKPSTATPNKLAHKKLLQLFFTCHLTSKVQLDITPRETSGYI